LRALKNYFSLADLGWLIPPLARLPTQDPMLYALYPMPVSSFSPQPPDQCTHLGSKIGNHNNENHQQKRICIDDP